MCPKCGDGPVVDKCQIECGTCLKTHKIGECPDRLGSRVRVIELAAFDDALDRALDDLMERFQEM